MNCISCRFYDMNDQINAFGTCEPIGEDFHCTHECSLSEDKIRETETLTGLKQTDRRAYQGN